MKGTCIPETLLLTGAHRKFPVSQRTTCITAQPEKTCITAQPGKTILYFHALFTYLFVYILLITEAFG